MEIIILTGMSGAGKSVAAASLEDLGYFCIDNLPPQLLPAMTATLTEAEKQGESDINRAAFVIDVRSSRFFVGLTDALEELDRMKQSYRIIFLDCEDKVLISRYKQSRRNHPMGEHQGIVQALADERAILANIRAMADQVIDTSSLTVKNLKNYLYQFLRHGTAVDERLSILVQSFGFKYGIPADCDEVIDVRFIPNPYYNPDLRPLSGLNEPVRTDVLDRAETEEYVKLRMAVFDYVLPYYVREGKVRYTLGIGCTGGRHRSVALAEHFASLLQEESDYRVTVSHRDINKDPNLQEVTEPHELTYDD